MAMFDGLFQVLADVPPMLAAAWAAWLVAGAALAVWFRRAKHAAELPAAPRPVAKPKTTPQPAADRGAGIPAVARLSPSADMQATETATVHQTPAPERSRPAPMVVGDPFGDLATLLDQPTAAAAAEPRAPADSPILNSSGSPLRAGD